jgi:hypothetical protein
MSFRVTKELLKTFLSEGATGTKFLIHATEPMAKIDFGSYFGMNGIEVPYYERAGAFHVSLTCEARPAVLEAARKNYSTFKIPLIPFKTHTLTASPIDPARLAAALDYVLRLAGDGDSWRTRITDLAEVRDRNSDADVQLSGGWIAVKTETAFHAARVPGLFDTEEALSPTDCAGALRWSAGKYDGRHLGMGSSLHALRLMRLALNGASRAYCRRYTIPDDGHKGLPGPLKDTAEVGQLVADHADGARIVLSSLITPRRMVEFAHIGQAEASVCLPGGARMFCGPAIPDEALEGAAKTKNHRVVFAIRPGRPLLVGNSTVLDPKTRATVDGSVAGGLLDRNRLAVYRRSNVTYLDGARYAVRDALAGVHGARVVFAPMHDGRIDAKMMVVSPERLAMVSLMGRYHDNVEGAPYAD